MDHDLARMRAVFDEVIEASREARADLLTARCGTDAELRRRVEALIAAAEDDAPFLADPTRAGASIATASTLGSVPLTERPGTRIGPYKLLQQIGEGGFGVVFMADQDQPVRRRVALKVIKLGMDTKQVVARFEQERQALALMDHPNVARVLDAGATGSGRPYFVMEYVKGDPITEFADARKLSVAERLGLFMQVCQAIQHAHTKGVIHRDLKPTNVLASMVDGQPFAKVIDFGIAKATGARLIDKTLFTEHHQLIGTPQYMSPEQAEGSLDIDTRTDVYSLGVLLYELLTGATPFDAERLRSAAYAEMQRIIREEEPPSPSLRLSRDLQTLAATAAARQVEPGRLGALVRGELDWIVMKALDKERGRRYESPSHLAADVGRHLAGDAVVAAPASVAYRVRKFVRRHKGPVVAGSAVAAALLLGIAGTTWHAAELDAMNARLRDETKRARLAEASLVVEQFLHPETPPTELEIEPLAKAVATREELLGITATDTIRSRWVLGLMNYYAGDIDEGVATMRLSLEHYEQAVSAPDNFLVVMYKTLANAELATTNVAAAEAYWNKLATLLSDPYLAHDTHKPTKYIAEPFGTLTLNFTYGPYGGYYEQPIDLSWGHWDEPLAQRSARVRSQLSELRPARLIEIITEYMIDHSPYWALQPRALSVPLSDSLRTHFARMRDWLSLHAPERADAWSAISLLAFRLGDYEQATYAATKAIDLASEGNSSAPATGQAVRAMSESKRGHTRGAEAALTHLRTILADPSTELDWTVARLVAEVETLLQLNSSERTESRYAP